MPAEFRAWQGRAVRQGRGRMGFTGFRSHSGSPVGWAARLFDRNLMYISPTGPASAAGVVSVSNSELAITAKSNSHPTVHLLTTPLSFSAALDAVVLTAPAQSVPLQIELWSAESSAGYALVFDPKGNVIRAETITNANALQDLVGGTITSTDIGSFQLVQPYRISINVVD